MNCMYLTALTNADHRKPAFANGQFLLIRRSAYEAIGGHERVKDQFTEDVELARLMKSLGYRIRLVWGRDYFAVRMYSSWPASFAGGGGTFTRSLRQAVADSARAVRSAVRILGLLAPFAGWYREKHPSIVSAAPAGRAAHPFARHDRRLLLIYAWSGNRKRYALLFPLGGAMLLRVFARALMMCATGKVEWRGTSYTHRVQATSSPAV